MIQVHKSTLLSSGPIQCLCGLPSLVSWSTFLLGSLGFLISVSSLYNVYPITIAITCYDVHATRSTLCASFLHTHLSDIYR